MGINRRKADMEIAFAIREANAAIAGVTLGQVCAAGIVSLEIACYECQRKGRYRLMRLIDPARGREGADRTEGHADGRLPEARQYRLLRPVRGVFPEGAEAGLSQNFRIC